MIMICSLRSISAGILHYVKSFWVPRMVGHPETTTSQMIQFLFQAHLFQLIQKWLNNTMLRAAPPQTTTIRNVPGLLMFLNVSSVMHVYYPSFSNNVRCIIFFLYFYGTYKSMENALKWPLWWMVLFFYCLPT